MSNRIVETPVRTLAVASVAFAAVWLAPARPAALTPTGNPGRAIVEEAQRRMVSTSQRYEGFLKSVDAGGKVSEKRWQYERLGVHGRAKSRIRFTDPPEVRGVALLVVNHPDRASDQWMWTPAIQRERRVALQDRSTRFFGTDFSFEDLDERDVDHYDYKLMGEEDVDGTVCWKIASTPRESKSSQYTQATFWIRKDNHAYARADFWIKDAVVRRLTYSDLRQVQGIWTAHTLTMTDLRRNGRTDLSLDKVQYNLPLRDGDFTLEAIRR